MSLLFRRAYSALPPLYSRALASLSSYSLRAYFSFRAYFFTASALPARISRACASPMNALTSRLAFLSLCARRRARASRSWHAPATSPPRPRLMGSLASLALLLGGLALALTCLALLFSLAARAAEPVSLARPADPAKKITGGISIGATRVVYNEADSGAVVRVINTSTVPFLIQTWVESYKGYGAEKAAALPAGAFITTPPLYRQDKGENSVRIVRARGDFAKDRESVFWLNVKAIPSTDKPAPGTNYVQFAFNTRLKLFYRPAGLPGKPSEAYKALTFSRSGNTLTATNPTVYNVTVNSLKVGGVTIEDADQRMVPPQGTQSWPLPAAAAGKTVTYVSLNDFGGLTPPLTAAAQ